MAEMRRRSNSMFERLGNRTFIFEKVSFLHCLQNPDAAQVTISWETAAHAAAATNAVAWARASVAARETARRASSAGGTGPPAPAAPGWARSTRTTHAAHTKVLSQYLNMPVLFRALVAQNCFSLYSISF